MQRETKKVNKTNMKIIADLHTHTSVSTHALSSMNEMITQAQTIGLKTLAITDHAPAMPDSAHPWYFHTLLQLQQPLPNGYLVLRGVEANVMDVQGTIDMPEDIVKKLDWVIASTHYDCIKPVNYEDATALWLNVAKNPYIDMIGHSEQKNYYYDYDLVTKAFAKYNKVVEINANSFYARPGNEANMKELALCCKKNGTKIAVNSDSHSIYKLGDFSSVIPLLEDIDFPEELIINASTKQLADELTLHGRSVASLVREIL